MWTAFLLTLAACQEPAPAPARTLQVFLVDESGTLLIDGWAVRLGTWKDTQIVYGANQPIDAATGCATISAFPHALVIVQGVHATGESTHGEQISLPDSGPTVLELEHDGPPTSRSLYVRLDSTPGRLKGSEPPVELVALDRDGRVVASLLPEANGLYVARGVEPGAYRIEARDPHFLPLVLERHTTGTLGRATLTGSATLTLRFVDARDGGPVVPSSITVSERRESFQGSSSSSRTLRTPVSPHLPPSHVELPGLLPGNSVSLVVSFDEYLPVLHDAGELAPGEARVREVPVTRGLELTGTVRDASGAPIEGVLVRSGDVPFLQLVQSSASGTAVVGGTMVFKRSDFAGGAIAVNDATRQQLLAVARRMQGAGPFNFGEQAVRTAKSDSSGACTLRGLELDQGEVFVHFTPWHVEVLPLARDERGAVLPFQAVAQHSGAADVEVALQHSQHLSLFSFELQVGEGPWLGPNDQRAPLFDGGLRIALRGLPEVPCRLRIGMGTGTSRFTSTEPLIVEFVPSPRTPTKVVIDLQSRIR